MQSEAAGGIQEDAGVPAFLQAGTVISHCILGIRDASWRAGMGNQQSSGSLVWSIRTAMLNYPHQYISFFSDLFSARGTSGPFIAATR